MPESLSDRYAELLSGSYDCADRIVLNAYFRMGHTAGGFRVWWRALTGSDDTLDNTHLMRMASRFSRRLHGYAKAEGIPLVHCQAGERKHELAENYLAKTQITQGLGAAMHHVREGRSRWTGLSRPVARRAPR